MTNANEHKAAGAMSPAACVSSACVREKPYYFVRVWPNRSLPVAGYRVVMLVASGGMGLALLPVWATPVMWGLLPFLLGTLLLLRWMLRRNYRDGRLYEELSLWPDHIRIERFELDGAVKCWSANPYWVRVYMYPEARPENYLTLKGNGREVEFGAFLSPEERVLLAHEIETAIARVRHLEA